MQDASFCLQCEDKTCLKTKKPCKNVEVYLRKHGIYSRDWIRPRVSAGKARDGLGKWREVPFSMLLHDIPEDKNDIMIDKKNTP